MLNSAVTTAEGNPGAHHAELPLQLFRMLDQSAIAAITSSSAPPSLVIMAFATTSESRSLVIDTIMRAQDAPLPQRVLCCFFERPVAIALLIGGGLGPLQSMAISTGRISAVVLPAMRWPVLRGADARAERNAAPGEGGAAG